MPHGDWDSVSSTGLRALRALAEQPDGRAVAGDVRPKVRTNTWRYLQRYSLVRTDDHAPVDVSTVVRITQLGRESIEAPAKEKS